MQLCDKSLDSWLKHRNQTVKTITNESAHHFEAVSVFTQILNGVKYIHSSGNIHRDLKPANILLIGTGPQVRIGDFGLSTKELAIENNDVNDGQHHNSDDTNDDSSNPIATGERNSHNNNSDDMMVKNRRQHSTKTRHTSGVGTFTYAAPEQLKGNSYSSKADLYSLGIILFELLYPLSTGMERAVCLKKLRRQGILPNDFKENFPFESSLVELLTNQVPELRPDISQFSFLTRMQSTEDRLKELISKINEKDKLIQEQQNELHRLHQLLDQHGIDY